jgi:hypothetical protein
MTMKVCVHRLVREDYHRIDATRYRVDNRQCVDCGERLPSITRRGGESAASKVVERWGAEAKDDPEAQKDWEGKAEHHGGDSEGKPQDSSGSPGGSGEGEGEDEGEGEAQEESEGGQEGPDGEQGEGEGEGEQGEGEGEGQPPPPPPPGMDAYVWAFRQHWGRVLSEKQRERVYQRVVLYRGMREG